MTKRKQPYRSRVVADGPAVPVNRNALYEEAMLSQSSTIDLIVEAPPERDPDLTFSRDAMENLRDAAMTWMGTRLIRHLNAGKRPRKMTATVTVTFDDEAPIVVPFDERPYFITDGQHRRRST